VASSHAVAVFFERSIRICSNPFSTSMINSYANLCNACAKGGDSSPEGQLAAQLLVTLDTERGELPILASSLLGWH
jgi:hypothetical protein